MNECVYAPEFYSLILNSNCFIVILYNRDGHARSMLMISNPNDVSRSTLSVLLLFIIQRLVAQIARIDRGLPFVHFRCHSIGYLFLDYQKWRCVRRWFLIGSR